jgi:hypothetical protein
VANKALNSIGMRQTSKEIDFTDRCAQEPGK